MKHAGSHFEYERQRNENLLRCFREVMSRSDGSVAQEEVCRRVVMMPSDRFWVSEERALVVIRNMETERHATLHKMLPLKRKMYKEIYRRVIALQEANPNLSKLEAVSEVVSSPAPEFYLTPGSAKVILCRMKKKEWYKARKQKLRHLFL